MPRAHQLVNIFLTGCSASLLLLLLFLVRAHGWASHYLFLAVVAIGLFSARWIHPRRKINLVLVVVSTLLSMYAAELVLASVISSLSHLKTTMWLTFQNDFSLETLRQRLTMARKDNPAFDVRSRLEVIRDLQREGITAYPAVFSEALIRPTRLGPERVDRSVIAINGVEILPLGGISSVLTVFCNESGEYVTYTSDEHGFHNPSGIWNIRPMDIVVLGDSFTQGACVPSDKNLVGRIRQTRPATLNLGIDSNGPLTALAALKEYGQPYQPKTVLWFYYEGNDLKDLTREQLSPLLMRYLEDSFSQELLSKQPEIDRSLITYVDRIRKEREATGETDGWEQTLKLYHIRQFLASVYQGSQKDPADRERQFATWLASEATDQEMELFRKVLLEAKTNVRGWGGNLYFVYLPEWSRYAKAELANKNRERVLRLVTTLGLPLIDVHPVFARQSDPLALFPFRRSGHYNAEGHRLVAEEVLRRLPFLQHDWK